MGSKSRLMTAIQPPPGRSISRPTISNPEPVGNPPIFNDAMTVRDKVFVDEQKCSPDMELDGDDQRSWQWVMYDEDTGTTDGARRKKIPVGVVRLVPPPHEPHEHLESTVEDGVDTTEAMARHDLPFIKLTRVALLKEYRGRGLSRMLVDIAMGWAAENPGEIETALGAGERWDGLVLVHAQSQLEDLYKRMGFVTDKGLGSWTEERMLHIGMWRTLDMKPRVNSS